MKFQTITKHDCVIRELSMHVFTYILIFFLLFIYCRFKYVSAQLLQGDIPFNVFKLFIIYSRGPRAIYARKATGGDH